ncbi:hypothetical protein GQ473_04730, partial [archaeon]|nr:hypothetical protein [archaeon]
HDPYSWSFTSPTIRYITQGNTLGEAMLNTIKNKPYEKYMKFLPHKYIGNELFDLETKNTYERILLGNPKTRLFEKQDQYLKSDTIISTTTTAKQTLTLTSQIPTTTFTITKTITNNYNLTNNTIVTNADEYIMYPGFPAIHVKTLINPLPQNANLQSIKFKPTYNTEKNLNITYMPYDQYYNQTINPITEQYPKINYNYEIYDNPDNTKEIHIITPLEIHNNTTTDILNKATIIITYTSPMEITNIIAKNTTINNNNTVEITITSSIYENGKLYLYLDNQEYESKNITTNTNTHTFNINTPKEGRHAVTIIYDGETSIPAKHANFYVFDPVFTLQPPITQRKKITQKSTLPFKFTVHDKITGFFIKDTECLITTETDTYPCGKGKYTTMLNDEEERYRANIELKPLNPGTNTITANILGTTKTFEIVINTKK